MVERAHIGRETIASLRASPWEVERLEKLLTQHRREIKHLPDDAALEVNWAFYEEAQAQGQLEIFGVRVGGELVGYAAYLLSVHPHCASSLQAAQDAIYLAPEHRKGLLGYQMLKVPEGALRERGCRCIYQHQKIAEPALGRLLTRLGYKPIEIIWSKRLD